MGKTYKRNNRWKKDRRDQHFRNSKKFKDVQHGTSHQPNKIITPSVEPDTNYDDLDTN